MQLRISFFVFLVFCSIPSTSGDSDEEEEQTKAGHSVHGEVFNEGPRQASGLMEGMGSVNFASSAKVPQTQAFINQGVAQLHGFWYFEAERSFRQAAALEPDLAIAYWGMAMANLDNEKRARAFIAEAVKREQQISSREKLYIKGLERYLKEEKTTTEAATEKKLRRQKREQEYLKDLEKILDEYPDDVEAKAFVALQTWLATRKDLPINSHYAIEALLKEIFAVNPLHPAHHFRIHLWDQRRAENALESAAKCGPSLPGIAHMWHMPGHTYSKLKRYADAAWQQEASARVDHAHMIRERILPDQIHNFAHNNEWLIRDWLLVGRVQDAIDLSKNMLSLPRHPVYNSGTGKGSAHFGRMRLQQTCLEYGLWGELLQSRSLLEPNPDDRPAQIVFQSWLAVALLFTDQRGEGTELLRKLRLDRIAAGEKLLALRRSSITGESAVEEGTLASTESPDDEQEVKGEEEKETGDAQKIKTLQKEIKLYREGIARVVAANAVLAKDGKKLEDQLKLAGEIPESLKIEWLHAADLPSRALELAKKSVKDGEGEVLPLAQLAWIQWQAENRESAMENFAKLRKLASGADIDLACFCRLKPLAEADKIEGDWRIAPELAKDLGPRPDLDSLGPVRWSPSLAPSWSAKTSEGEPIECGCFANRPYLLIFYLGFGCLHCMEQLHAIEPHLAKFQEQGIEVVAIGSDSVEDLKKAIEDLDDEHSLSMKLLSGNDLSAFRAFRSYDDFEKRPLHGTLLIDSLGRIRWQDIGHEPFMKIDFLLKETQRLLSPPKGTTEWP